MIAASKEQLGFKAQLNVDFDQALKIVESALKEEGFGILTEIDVQKTMKTKLDKNYPHFRILGACNPPLADKALSHHHDLGLLLPCNVTVVELEKDTIEISLIDPMQMMHIVQEPAIQEIAQEAKRRLSRVASSLEEYE